MKTCVMKLQPLTTSAPGIRLCDRQPRVHHQISHGKYEKRSHTRVLVILCKGQLATERATSNDLNFGVGDTFLIGMGSNFSKNGSHLNNYGNTSSHHSVFFFFFFFF